MSGRRTKSSQKVDTAQRAETATTAVVPSNLPQAKADPPQETKGDSGGVTQLLQKLVDLGMEGIEANRIELKAGDVIKAMGLLLQYKIEPDAAALLAKALQNAKTKKQAQLRRMKQKREKAIDAEFKVVDGS